MVASGMPRMEKNAVGRGDETQQDHAQNGDEQIADIRGGADETGGEGGAICPTRLH